MTAFSSLEEGILIPLPVTIPKGSHCLDSCHHSLILPAHKHMNDMYFFLCVALSLKMVSADLSIVVTLFFIIQNLLH